MIINPVKLGISVALSVVLLYGGIMILTRSSPELSINQSTPIPDVIEEAVPSITVSSSIDSATTNSNEAEPTEQTAAVDDKMEVEVMQASLEDFDPISSGDWSLENLSDFALEISQ